MSSFLGKAKHPKTGKICTVLFLADHFGRHKYGVQFSKRQIYPESTVIVVSDVCRPVQPLKLPAKSVWKGKKAGKTPLRARKL